MTVENIVELIAAEIKAQERSSSSGLWVTSQVELEDKEHMQVDGTIDIRAIAQAVLKGIA